MTNIRYLVFTLALTVFLTGCSTANQGGLRISGEGIIQSPSSPLMWQQNRSRLFTTAEEATNYIETLKLGGFTDWRLPTGEELLDLYFDFDFGSAKAEELGIRVEGNYWFMNKDGSPETGAWKDDGDICEITRGYRRSESGYVRAVRP